MLLFFFATDTHLPSPRAALTSIPVPSSDNHTLDMILFCLRRFPFHLEASLQSLDSFMCAKLGKHFSYSKMHHFHERSSTSSYLVVCCRHSSNIISSFTSAQHFRQAITSITRPVHTCLKVTWQDDRSELSKALVTCIKIRQTKCTAFFRKVGRHWPSVSELRHTNIGSWIGWLFLNC